MRPLDLFRIGMTLDTTLRAPSTTRKPAVDDDALYDELMELFGRDSGIEPVLEP